MKKTKESIVSISRVLSERFGEPRDAVKSPRDDDSGDLLLDDIDDPDKLMLNSKQAYEDYSEWCKQNNIDRLSYRAFRDSRGRSLEEKAPPGHEDTVKALKRDPNVENPWAVAWAAKNKKKKRG